MKYGFVFPGGDVTEAVEFGVAAERAGWDGFFVWDPVWGVDPWVTLAAIAARTERIRLGTLLTPASRRRPWKLAGETATLDRLSNGRLILAVGLGAPDTGFESFGEVTDRKTRAELMDECLAIVDGLWRGQPFTFSGKHYQVKAVSFQVPPPPIQTPRIPVWVVGLLGSQKSIGRVLQWDGLLPAKKNADGEHATMTPDDLRAMKAYIEERRTADTPFDIIWEGESPGDDRARAAELVRPYAEAGATWWIESRWTAASLDSVRERLEQGPPPQEL